MNTILICADEHLNYDNIPNHIKEKLTGYQKLRKMGIEFTNFQCNRQACSPSRSVLLSGIITTAIQDNYLNMEKNVI